MQEIESVVRQLTEFHPTHIAVEISGQYQADNTQDFSGLKVASERDADKAILAFFQQYSKEMLRISADPERRFNAQDDFPKTHLLKPFLNDYSILNFNPWKK